MLQNAYFLAKIGADTAENEQHLAEILPIGRRVADRCAVLELPGRFHIGTSPIFGKFRQDVARFRLYRHRFLQEDMRCAAFFEIYQIIKLKFLKFGTILQILRHLQIFKLFFAEFAKKMLIFQTDFCENFEIAAVQNYANLVSLKNAVKRIFSCKISF